MNKQKAHENSMADICINCGKPRGAHCYYGKTCPSGDGAWILGSRFKSDDRGTQKNPIRYEHLDKADPEYKTKFQKQLDQFEDDAKAGKVLCLTDLMISAEM